MFSLFHWNDLRFESAKYNLWLASCLLLFAGCENLGKPELDLQFAGGTQSGIISSDEFTLKVWHQHPGSLRNGVLKVTVQGKQLRSESETKKWSFDSWPPNEASAQEFTYEIESRGDDLRLNVTVEVQSADIQTRTLSDVWHGDGWQTLSEREVERAAALQADGKSDEALKLLDSAIELDPSNANAYLGRARLYLARGDTESAKTNFIACLDNTDSKSLAAECHLSVGIFDAEAGRLDKAIERFTDAIEADPTLMNAYAARGNAYQRQRKYLQALADVNMAVSLDPKADYLYVDRARVHAFLGDMELATSDAERAIALNPESGRAIGVMALIDVINERWEDALPRPTTAIEKMPNEASFYELRAGVYKEVGDTVSSDADLEQAQRIRQAEGYKNGAPSTPSRPVRPNP